MRKRLACRPFAFSTSKLPIASRYPHSLLHEQARSNILLLSVKEISYAFCTSVKMSQTSNARNKVLGLADPIERYGTGQRSMKPIYSQDTHVAHARLASGDLPLSIARSL